MIPSSKKLLNLARARMPWQSVAAPILRSINVLLGHGWQATIAKMGEDPLERDQKIALRSAILEHHTAGEKAIQVLEVTASQMDALRTFSAPHSGVGQSDYQYPRLLADADIAGLTTGQLSVLTAQHTKYGRAIIYQCIRTFKQREPVPIKKVSDIPGGAAGVEGVYLVRRVRQQMFDAIWVPHEGTRVMLLADFPAGANRDLAQVGLSLLREQINNDFGVNAMPLNLYAAVPGLYKATDGEVVTLGHAPQSDFTATKHERIRRQNKCLKTENFHQGGMSAIDSLSAKFKISKRWELHHEKLGESFHGFNSYPVLTIPGHSRMIGLSAARVDYAYLSNTASTRDLHFLLDQLNNVLP